MALKSELTVQIRNIIDAQVPFVAERLNGHLLQVTSDMARRGLGLSGPLIMQLKAACDEELQHRAAFIWQTFDRVLRTNRQSWYDGISSDLKAEMRSYLRGAAGELNRVFQQKLPEGMKQYGLTITVDETASVNRYNAEIDLYCAGMKADADIATARGQPDPAIHNQYNFHAAVGSFQMGDNTVANVVINPQNNAEMLRVLDQIAGALRESNVVAEEDRRETLELLQDGISELRKEHPNKRRLLTVIHSIGDVVGLLADGATLYPLLAAAASAMGITI